MIIDNANHIAAYAALCPRFSLVAEFLASHDLRELPLGRHEIAGEDVFVNIVESAPKQRAEARLESHDEMIDIQILLEGSEWHGFHPRACLEPAPYDAANDISFYDAPYDSLMHVVPGYAVIYFPEDAHAPAICDAPIRKAIFKVKK